MRYALVKVSRFNTGSIKFLGIVNGLTKAKYHAMLHAMCEADSEVSIFRVVDNVKMAKVTAYFGLYSCLDTNPPTYKEFIRGAEVKDYV